MLNNHKDNRQTLLKAQAKHFKEYQDVDRVLRQITAWITSQKDDIKTRGYSIDYISETSNYHAPRFNIYVEFNQEMTEYRIKSIVKRG